MIKLKFRLLLFTLFYFCVGYAKDYNASIFGIKSNGTVLNTTSIQKAIDYIYNEGGGNLNFYVGRYLTGTIELKSNVHIILHEGAILVGSTNIYDYNIEKPYNSMIFAKNATNISIMGDGVIDGQGSEVAYNIIDQINKGILEDTLDNSLTGKYAPKEIYLKECKNIKIEGITLKNAAGWTQIYDQCYDLTINNITVDSKAFLDNDGLDVIDCKNVQVTNSFFDTSGDAICFKSLDTNKSCENILVYNNVTRSSANGIKLGTETFGGCKDIKIIKNKVYDTYKSAITISTPDGGTIDNILVDSLMAYNIGNAIYLRIGARSSKKQGSIKNITIQNFYAEISAEKPDAGYAYEGPNENMPRNVSPSGIVGLRGCDITNITLRNIEIIYPGGSNPKYAYRGTKSSDLDDIPEMEDSYPEFSQFKELPAWGFYVRYAKDIKFENVTLTAKGKEYRPAIVFHDVKGAELSGMKYNRTDKGKTVYSYKSSGIIQNK